MPSLFSHSSTSSILPVTNQNSHVRFEYRLELHGISLLSISISVFLAILRFVVGKKAGREEDLSEARLTGPTWRECIIQVLRILCRLFLCALAIFFIGKMGVMWVSERTT